MGYIRTNYGDSCFYEDNSFKRFNRYHNRNSASIWTGSNCHAHHCHGGFWHGFGSGLLANAGSWLYGGLTMLGGLIFSKAMGPGMNCQCGGQNMYPMSNGGWGSINNCFNFGGNLGWQNGDLLTGAGYYGLSSVYPQYVKPETVKPETDDNGTLPGDGKANLDNPKFTDLTAKVAALIAKENPTDDEVEALRAEIQEAKNETDDVQADSDKETYDNLLKILNSKHPPKSVGNDGKDGGKAGDNGVIGNGDAAGNIGANPETVTVDGQAVKVSELTSEQIGKLKVEDFNKVPADKITLTQEQAKKILENSGIKTDGTALVGDIITKGALELVQKAEVKVKVAKNTHKNASTDEGFIRGTISNVTKDASGKVTFTVDNSVYDGDIGLTYTFTQTGDKIFKISEIENKKDKPRYICTGWQNREYKLGDDKFLEINDATTLASKWNTTKGVIIAPKTKIPTAS